MTKMRITVISSAGDVEVRYVSNDDPWTESETIVKITASASGVSSIVNVPAGNKIRPVFNYYNGTADGSLIIKLEGSESINSMEAVGDIQKYLGS